MARVWLVPSFSLLATTIVGMVSMALDSTPDGLMPSAEMMIKHLSSRGTTCVPKSTEYSMLGSCFSWVGIV